MTVINRNAASPVFETLANAIAANMRVGQICLVKNNISSDRVALQYEVKANGSGGIAMNNGNELYSIGLNQVASVADIFGLTGVAGQQISVGEYNSGSNVGNFKAKWRPDLARTVHDGVRYHSPARDLATEGLSAYLSASTDSDLGVWENEFEGGLKAVWSGLLAANASSLNSICLQAAINTASGKEDVVLMPAGDFIKLDDTGVTVPANMTIGSDGGGNQSFINCVEAVLGFAIQLTGNYITLKDIQLFSSTIGVGKGIEQLGEMVYLKTWNCEINRLEHGFRYDGNNAYWGEHYGLILRDNTKGITAVDGVNRINATAFYGLQTFHFNPSAADFAVELDGQEGVSFRGSIQNQGFRFVDCKGITLDLDYVEEPSGVSVLEAINSEINMPSRTNWMPGTASSIDADSYEKSSGWLPGTNRFEKTRFSSGKMSNLLPETKNLTDWTLSQTGASGGVAWDTELASGGSITLTSTKTTSRKSVTAADTNSIFMYARVVVTGDAVRIISSGGDAESLTDLQPSVSDQYVRVWAERAASGQMSFIFLPLTANATTLEIKEILVSTDKNILSIVQDNKETSGELISITRLTSATRSDVFVVPSTLTTLFSVPDTMPNGTYLYSANASDFASNRARAVGVIYKTSSGLAWTPLVESLCTISVNLYDIEVTMNAGQPNIIMNSGLATIT